MMNDLKELSDMDLKEASTCKDIYPIVYILSDCFQEGLYDEVDAFLRNVDVGNLSTLAKICIVRSTFSARDKLSGWVDFRDRVAATIDDPEKLLKGLF